LTLSKRDEQEYALRANEDIEMYELEDDEEEEEAVMDELDGNEMTVSFVRGLTSTLAAEDDEEDEEQSEEEDEFPEELRTGDKNSQLAVGFKGDRSYVVRGNKIGVFRHSGDQDKVEYYATIGNIADTKGKKFNPKKVRLPII